MQGKWMDERTKILEYSLSIQPVFVYTSCSTRFMGNGPGKNTWNNNNIIDISDYCAIATSAVSSYVYP